MTIDEIMLYIRKTFRVLTVMEDSQADAIRIYFSKEYCMSISIKKLLKNEHGVSSEVLLSWLKRQICETYINEALLTKGSECYTWT